MRVTLRVTKNRIILKVSIYAVIELLDGAQKRTRTSTPCGTRT